MSQSTAQPTAPTTPVVSEARVWEALTQVEDPELGVDIVNLGLVYAIRVHGTRVAVEMTLTSLGCPAGPQIEQAVIEALGNVGTMESIQVLEPYLRHEQTRTRSRAREAIAEIRRRYEIA